MNKRVLFLLVLGVFIYGLSCEGINANPQDSSQPESFEEIFTKGGYKTVEGALEEFEDHYKQKLKLPLRVPPISFTHYFGKFIRSNDRVNDSFEVKYISDQISENHFKISVRPIQHKTDFDKYTTKVFKLDDGSEAKYMEVPKFPFNFLVFEKDDWQYIFSIDKRVLVTVTPEVLVQIANSIDYSSETRK